MKKNNEAQIFGEIIIRYFKLVWSGINGIYQTKLKTKKLKIFFATWMLTNFILVVKLVKLDYHDIYSYPNMLKYLILAFINLPLLNLANRKHRLQKQLEKKQIYDRMGFKEHLPMLDDFIIDGKLTIYRFWSNGRSVEDFKRNKDVLENFLSKHRFGGNKEFCQIVNITKNKHDRRIIELVTANSNLKDLYKWDETLVQDNKIFIGESIYGSIHFNFEKVPHLFIAGGTGGGKGNMNMNIILQLLAQSISNKNICLTIADFKSGLDYAKFTDHINLIEKHSELDEFLDQLIEEMNRRNNILRNSKLPNIKEYNKLNSPQLPRYYLIVDEIAEAIDIKGLDKTADQAERKIKLKIRRKLTSLARLSRAAGIHLILTAQLPTVDIFGNQLKNNINGRICGPFADESASRVVLDSKEASNLPEIEGRMIYQAGLEKKEIQTPFVYSGCIDNFLKKYSTRINLKNTLKKINKTNKKNETKNKLYSINEIKENKLSLVKKGNKINESG
jgi:S-DNA-T family DNA segregation ATPase FtsK/SpoIIIE